MARLVSYDLTRLWRPATGRLARRFPRLATRFREGRYALRLMLGGKLGLFAVVDALLVFSGFFDAAVGGAEPGTLFLRLVVLPGMLLGIPALSSLVALERRAGSLDLALAVASPVGYFVRRASWVAGILAVQGVAVLLTSWLAVAGAHFGPALTRDGPVLLRALVQTLVFPAVLVAASLFWASRLRGAGGVALATAATLLVLMPWIQTGPALESNRERLLGIPIALLGWLAAILVLLGAATFLFLDARDRLRRPGVLLT